MTLLTTVFAAIICTVIWYKNEEARKLKIGTLCFMYWGASLMWLIDAIFAYAEEGAESFAPSPLTASEIRNIFSLNLSFNAVG